METKESLQKKIRSLQFQIESLETDIYQKTVLKNKGKRLIKEYSKQLDDFCVSNETEDKNGN